MNIHMFVRNSWRVVTSPRPLLILTLTISLAILSLLSITGKVGASPISDAVPEAATLNNWTNLYPDLQRISAISSDEAWAAGSYGELLHYAGGAWVSVDVPSMHGIFPYDINMRSANDGWIAAGYRAFQYDGSAWVEQSIGLGYNIASVYSIASIAPNDAWGVAWTPGGRGFIHWDGTQWSPAGPILAPSTYMNAISMSSASEGWAIGQVYVNSYWQGTIYHFDGANWQQMSNPSGIAPLRGIWTSPTMPGDAWATGGDSSHAGTVYHYSSGSWASQDTPGSTVPGSIFMVSPDEGWATSIQPITGILHWDGSTWSLEYTSDFYIRSVSGAPGTTWAVGNGGTVLSRFSDTAIWSRERGSPTFNNLNAVDALSANDAWAVGMYNTALHYDGTSWQPVPTLLDSSYYDVQMLATNNVYAVGSNAIAHWDGETWSRVALPMTTLRGISMTSPGEGWAVGDSGSIWHSVGGQWSSVSTGITRTLTAVAMDSPSHGWAVGGDLSQQYSSVPALIEYTGGVWVDRSATLPPNVGNLEDIVLAPGGNEGWAVGQHLSNGEYPIIHLINGVWSIEPGVAQAFLNSVDMLSSDDVWAVSSPAYHRTGGVWTQTTLPTSSSPAGIALVPGFGGWAVGAYGTILRYDLRTGGVTPTSTTLIPSSTTTQTRTPAPTNTTSCGGASPDCSTSTRTRTAVPPTTQVTDTPITPSATVTASATSTPQCPLLTWHTIPNPVTALMQAVEAIAPDNVWAAGDDGYILHYDGTAWIQVTSPTTSTIYSLSATSEDDLWAAGLGGVFHWDGSEWSVALAAASSEWYNGVKAISPTDVWAIGMGPGTYWPVVLTMHWAGSEWTHIIAPAPNAHPNGLNAINALSSTDVWVVGYWSGPNVYPFILHWDGTQWANKSPSAEESCAFGSLADIAAISSNDVWAVGQCSDGTSLAIHYDGTTWSRSPTPDIGSLETVYALATDDVWAGGILHWDGSEWTVSYNSSLVYDIDALSPDDVWAVGFNFLHYYSQDIFSDVPPTNPFYPYIQCLACRNGGVISGYDDGTFRPNNSVTRSQIAKIVSNAAGYADDPGPQVFADVPPSHTFYTCVQRLASRGVMTGYSCGGPTEPCDLDGKPYFRPYSDATRSQLAKIVAIAAGYDGLPATQHFTDVPPDNRFYLWIELLASDGIMSGYPCGGPNEPCDDQNRPYFRPYNIITRGQTAKIVAGAFFPGCQPSSRP
jgi:hypothetical protein